MWRLHHSFQTCLSYAILCWMVPCQYLFSSSHHRASLPLDHYPSMACDVHQLSCIPVMCPAQVHFCFLTFSIMPMSFVCHHYYLFFHLSMWCLTYFIPSLLGHICSKHWALIKVVLYVNYAYRWINFSCGCGKLKCFEKEIPRSDVSADLSPILHVISECMEI